MVFDCGSTTSSQVPPKIEGRQFLEELFKSSSAKLTGAAGTMLRQDTLDGPEAVRY
jgi:hypothetical protein